MFQLVLLLLFVVIIVANWKIYEKAGQPGWASIIPIYGFYVLLKIVGKPTWWLILMLIPVVNIVFIIWTINLLSKSFGKEEGFKVRMLILGIVIYNIQGFDIAQ